MPDQGEHDYPDEEDEFPDSWKPEYASSEIKCKEWALQHVGKGDPPITKGDLKEIWDSLMAIHDNDKLKVGRSWFASVMQTVADREDEVPF